MPTVPFTVIDTTEPRDVEATLDGNRVYLAPAALESALGWTLRPEGLCRGDVCIPVADRAALATDAGVDLAAVAALLRRPYAVDPAEGAAAVGTGADERGAQLRTGAAPDFTLPDHTGTPHTLSDYRNRKLMLVAWASW